MLIRAMGKHKAGKASGECCWGAWGGTILIEKFS